MPLLHALSESCVLARVRGCHMLVLDGDARHPWDSETPFQGQVRNDLRNYYSGDLYGRGYRYYKRRRSVSMSLGFHMNGTKSCTPGLSEKVNIGIYCSWKPPTGGEWTDELNSKPCQYSLRVSLIPEIVYDGYQGNLPIAPAGELGLDDHVPTYMQDEGYALSGQLDAEKIGAISAAARQLCLWCRSYLVCQRLQLWLQPKQRALAERHAAARGQDAATERKMAHHSDISPVAAAAPGAAMCADRRPRRQQRYANGRRGRTYNCSATPALMAHLAARRCFV